MQQIFVNRFCANPRPEGRAVVFLHGAGMDSTIWAQQARYLAARSAHVLAPDLPGHGRSPGPPLPSINDMAQWLAGFLRDQALEDCVLVGHSMGTFVAIQAATLMPVSQLVLIGTASTMPVHPELLEAAKNDLPLAAALIGEWAFPPGYDHDRQAVPSMSLRLAGIRLLERSQAGVLANDLQACADYDGALMTISKIDCAKSIIAGERDRMTPLKSAKSLAKAGGADFIVLKGVGHMAPLERPAEVRRILADLLAVQ